MLMPSGLVKQPQINAAVLTVERELAPWVRHIRYDILPDWAGDWSIFFRVVLSDEASRPQHLRDVTAQVVWRMSECLNIPELGLFPYFDFRSESEQATLNQPEWAAAS